MEFSAEMIAGLVQGTVVGDPKAMVNDFAKIEEGRPGCISLPMTSMSIISTKRRVVWCW